MEMSLMLVTWLQLLNEIKELEALYKSVYIRNIRYINRSRIDCNKYISPGLQFAVRLKSALRPLTRKMRF